MPDNSGVLRLCAEHVLVGAHGHLLLHRHVEAPAGPVAGLEELLDVTDTERCGRATDKKDVTQVELERHGGGYSILQVRPTSW